MKPTRIKLIPNDWSYLEGVLSRLTKLMVDQPMTIGSTPTFAGLTLTGLNGVLKATAGTVSGGATFDSVANGTSIAMRTNLNADLLDGQHAASFEGAFTKYTLTGTTNQINLSASGIDTLLARDITLSLPQDIHTGASPTFAGLINSGLTSGRVTFATTGGSLTDSSALTFSSTFLNIGDSSNARRAKIFGGSGSGDLTITGVRPDMLLDATGLTGGVAYNWCILQATNTDPVGPIQWGVCGIFGQANVGGTPISTYLYFDNRTAGAYNNAHLKVGQNGIGVGITGTTIPARILDVRGETSISGNTRIGSTTAPTVPLDVLGASILGGNVIIGIGTAATDYTLTFNGETNDGILTWMENEDYFKFSDDIMLVGGENLVLDTSTGTKIGTATTQLLGFYNATPVNQPDTVSDAATQDLTGTDTIDKTKLETDLTSCKNTINTVIDRLQELGLIA